eukprot:1542269-Rhodomonas_salina.1
MVSVAPSTSTTGSTIVEYLESSKTSSSVPGRRNSYHCSTSTIVFSRRVRPWAGVRTSHGAVPALGRSPEYPYPGA